MNNLFYSMITIIIAFFFILLGIIGVIVPWSAGVRTSLIQFILDDSLAISLFGFTSMVVGFAIVANIFINAKRHYYHIRSDDNGISIDETVIQQYLDAYWKELFPAKDIPSRLTLKNNTIAITVDFPHLPINQQQLILERVKHDLREKFSEILGYHHEFTIAASFQSLSKNNSENHPTTR